MSLIQCPACQKEVSPRAPACPNCAEPLKSSVEISQGGAFNINDPVHSIGLLVVVVPCILILIVFLISLVASKH